MCVRERERERDGGSREEIGGGGGGSCLSFTPRTLVVLSNDSEVETKKKRESA